MAILYYLKNTLSFSWKQAVRPKSVIDNMNDGNINTSDDKLSPISDYYRGKTIFLTGVTGFLGQCFLEKLLRIGAKCVYVLVRSRKDQSPEVRCENLLQSRIFGTLIQERPNFADDIILINGSLDDIELSISQDDQMNLFTNVELVIHAAADIRFDVPLPVVALRNVRGTRELLKLAQKMEKLDNFIFISTAYSFCFRDVTGEEFYEPPVDSETIIKIVETMTSEKERDILNIVSEKIVTPWPNTYTFSKAITENLVKQYRNYFKITIIRPSIVTATFKEPIKGWNANFAGLNGVLTGIIAGVLRCLRSNDNVEVDMVCCDFVINAALCCAYDVTQSDRFTPVYNVISGNDFKVRHCDIKNTMYSYRRNHIPLTALWYPFLFYTTNSCMFFICSMLFHVLPGMVLDAYLKMKGKKPRIMKIYRTVQNFSDVLDLFIANSFKFENDNTKRICCNLTTMDKQIFQCDFGTLNWSEYFKIYIYEGLVRSLLKEDLDYRKMAKQSTKLFIIHYSTVAILSLWMVFILWFILLK